MCLKKKIIKNRLKSKVFLLNCVFCNYKLVLINKSLLIVWIVKH